MRSTALCQCVKYTNTCLLVSRDHDSRVRAPPVFVARAHAIERDLQCIRAKYTITRKIYARSKPARHGVLFQKGQAPKRHAQCCNVQVLARRFGRQDVLEEGRAPRSRNCPVRGRRRGWPCGEDQGHWSGLQDASSEPRFGKAGRRGDHRGSPIQAASGGDTAICLICLID